MGDDVDKKEGFSTKCPSSTGTCLVVGISGPSGCGKTSLVSQLGKSKRLRRKFTNISVFAEDPKFFRAPSSESYQDRDPRSETPSHVNWDTYLESLQEFIIESTSESSVVLVEHFLLLHDPRVVKLVDVLIFLDPNMGGNAVDATEVCLRRRIQRNPNRSKSEIKHLSLYYRDHVWPSYLKYTYRSASAFVENHPDRSVRLDCTSSSDFVLSQAEEFILQLS